MIVLARRSIYDVATLIIALVSLVVLVRWKVQEPILIACAAAAGLLLRAVSLVGCNVEIGTALAAVAA